MDTIELSIDEAAALSCSCMLVVPDKAIAEPGYIKGMTVGESGYDKHQLQALAQTAYYQFQDDELTVERPTTAGRVNWKDQVEVVTDGMLLYRTLDGAIGAAVLPGGSDRKLLEAAYRFCTRWVRLDI